MAGRTYVFIIPGFRHKPTNKGYLEIKKLLKKEGFFPISISIPWKKSTISENTEHFLKKYNGALQRRAISPRQIYLLGFSYGAMIAFLASTKIAVKGLILCSLSPFFKEDLPKSISPKCSILAERRFDDFTSLKSNVLAKKVKAKKILMLYGTQESRPLIRRVTATFKQVNSPKKYLFPIRNTHHDIADKKYLYTIHHAVKELL